MSHFAELYGKKLGIRQEVLRRTLWGDFFLNSKAKRIFKGAMVTHLPLCAVDIFLEKRLQSMEYHLIIKFFLFF